MNKLMILTLAAGIFMSLTACGSKNESSGGEAANTKTEQNAPADGNNAAEDIAPGNAGDDFEVKSNSEGVIFRVNHNIKLKEDAWLGVVPKGKEYTNEVDADEVDIYYSYYSNNEKKDSEDYEFFYDPNCIEDGEYSMVLCDTDGDDGKVLVQFDMKKSGKDITPEFSTAKYNLE